MCRRDQTIDSRRKGRHEEKVLTSSKLSSNIFISILLFRIQERIVARRREQQVEEEQKAKEMEKKRITDGKTLSEIKQK